MASTKSLSKILQDVEFQPLGKRSRRPVSYKEEIVEGEEPVKKKKKRKPSPRPSKKINRRAKPPTKKKPYAFCESDDDDDGLLSSEGEENSESDSDEVLLDLASDDSLNIDLSDEEESKSSADDSLSGEDIMEESEENTGPTIDKLLNYRVTDDDSEEYLIKWKDKSYWHVDWLARETLEEMVGGKTRIRHFRPSSFDTFNPRLAEIDRIIDADEENNYLCKWHILGYDESTWESYEDIQNHGGEERIEEYFERETLPLKKQLKPFKRPRPTEFDPDTVSIPKFKNDLALHDYQEDGLKWLICCWYAQRSSILADEMGLGKTIQSVAILEYLCNVKGNRGPFIVVAPVSTLEQWRREIESWTDLNCVLYHGSAASREIIRQREWRFDGARKYKQLFKFQILLTSYQTVLTDQPALSKIKWQYLIIDEGHRLKNTKSKLFECLQGFHTEHRLVLTGTPLQNNIQELWAILNFVDPYKFTSLEEFESQYGDLKNSRHRKRLHNILSAYLLRRLKEDVFKSLPIKEETIIETELTAIQKRFYKAILDRNREFLCKGVKSSNVPSLINIMVELRKCCNHPFLINGAEEKIIGNLEREIAIDKALEAMVNSSAKLIILDKLLGKLRAEGHQVLIFSQMTQLLNILEDYMNAKQYPYERLDGAVSLTNRQASIDRFSNKENDNFVFLLSTRAGGLGLNLTAANTAVIFDSDWNPQNDLQAQARCHRIGQTENVKIYRLVTKNTYEEYMLSVASKKLGLEMVVLSSDDNASLSGSSKSLDKKEVDHLLKYGAYHLFNSSEEEDQDEEKKLLSEDINSILNRATTLKYDESEKSKDKHNLGNLSKVTYQIDFEDETFWDSVLPEHKTAPVLLKQLKNNDDDEFSKPEVRASFLEDLVAVVEDLQETLDARSKSFAFSSQAPVVAVSNLIEAIINCELFTSAEKEPLYPMQNSIISTKRERKTVDRSMPTDPVDIEKRKQQKKAQHEASLAAAAEAKKEADLKKETEWTKNLRDKVKNGLISLGPGRWGEIASSVFPSDEKRTKTSKQMRALCESMIQQYFGREDVGVHQLVSLKEGELPFPKGFVSFYAKWIQAESDNITKQLTSHYQRHPLPKKNPKMISDWAKTSIKLSSEFMDIAEGEKPKFESGQKITLLFENIPSLDTGSFFPVFVLLRLVNDEKKEGSGCVVQAYFLERPVESLPIVVPGYVGDYRIQFWSPLWTKTPSINTKKAPFAVMSVNCPETLDTITRFASQRWIAQCEFMKALDKLLQMKYVIPPTKPPVWWWNTLRDDDAVVMKGVLHYGYGHYSAIKADKSFGFDEESLKAKLQDLWNQKSPKEKIQLGYSTKGSDSVPTTKPNAKRKLKDDPFEFPSTTTLNSHIKQFLKVNQLLDNDTTQAAPPKPKPKKKKRKPAALPPPKKQIVHPPKRDSSPENFVKKKTRKVKKKRSSTTGSHGKATSML